MSERGKIEVGNKYGRLSIIAHEFLGGRSVVFCRCDCGRSVTTRLSRLKNGKQIGCGCLRGTHAKSHGHAVPGHESPTYSSWGSMKDRCSHESHPSWSRYGGRGISVCSRWLSFESFLEDMGERPSGTSLDRIDNDGNYEPGNCRWATAKEQNRNTSGNRLLTYAGKTLPVVVWAEETGLPSGTIHKRLSRGWDAAKTLSVPYLGRGGRI